VADSARRDPYDVLGVPRTADEAEIKKAYRRLARKYHPDVARDDRQAEERFKEVSEAYAFLSDAEKRRAYDEFGEIALEPNFDAAAARRARAAFGERFRAPPPGGDMGGFGEPFGPGGFAGFDDLMEELLARRGREARPHRERGADLHAEFELGFLEAARGGEKRVTLTRPTADGSPRTETVTIRIPAGVADGGRIRIPGKGAEGRAGSPPGDLFATIRIRPHPFFERKGRDVTLDLPVTIREATLGARIEIPTLEGRATVTIPPGTDSGQRLRLRGKGIPNPAGGPPGDLYVTVEIRVPRNLDAEAASRLDDLARFDVPDLRKALFEGE
jgi:DnaJ-class molecular chaperone